MEIKGKKMDAEKTKVMFGRSRVSKVESGKWPCSVRKELTVDNFPGKHGLAVCCRHFPSPSQTTFLLDHKANHQSTNNMLPLDMVSRGIWTILPRQAAEYRQIFCRKPWSPFVNNRTTTVTNDKHSGCISVCFEN